MNVLVIGSGGREHALVWKLKQSDKVRNIYVCPGNAGTAEIAQNLPFTGKKEIVEWLKENDVDLVVVGPDDFLADGIVDDIQSLGMAVFGPTKAAAQIEWSKSFAKELMREGNIPTASSVTFESIEEAQKYLHSQTFPLVIKADGLALGKGVMIVEDIEEASVALKEMMEDKKHGDAGSKVVIEEFLEGIEISAHAFCDGTHVSMFPLSQDHKRAFDSNKGPNTGGMGTIAPVPNIPEDILREIKKRIIEPALKGLKKRGRPFVGVLYPGVMLTKEGPKVIEFNARFGDPEAQSYMRLLDTDLLEILLACVEGKLNDINIKWKESFASCVVAASRGYPNTYDKGFPIEGLSEAEESDNVVVFHAGTKIVDGKVVTNGGRVLNVTAVSLTLKASLKNAYSALSKISFRGMWFRKDIGLDSMKIGTDILFK